jgi:hypothetical protein
VRAGQHILDESLVPGDIDQPEAHIAERQVGETEIDRDPAFLLFFEAVGIYSGQRFDERGLAVIDVSGGADDDSLHIVLKDNDESIKAELSVERQDRNTISLACPSKLPPDFSSDVMGFYPVFRLTA